MIFYFSATGNSKYVAERVAGATDDHLIFLRTLSAAAAITLTSVWEKRIGFVVPAYCCGLPSILNFFVDKLRLSGYEDQYVYLVLTCGSATGDAAGQLGKLLGRRGLPSTPSLPCPWWITM